MKILLQIQHGIKTKSSISIINTKVKKKCNIRHKPNKDQDRAYLDHFLPKNSSAKIPENTNMVSAKGKLKM